MTPACWAKAIAFCASASGNVRVINRVGSTSRESSNAIALANGPHREPTTVISFTTIGQVSTGAAPWKVDLRASVPRGSIICCASVSPLGEPVASTRNAKVSLIRLKSEASPRTFRVTIPARPASANFFSCLPYITTRDARHGRFQNARDKLRELAITEDRNGMKLLRADLIEDFASRRERLDKHSLFVTEAVWNQMKIL